MYSPVCFVEPVASTELLPRILQYISEFCAHSLTVLPADLRWVADSSDDLYVSENLHKYGLFLCFARFSYIES